MKTLCSGLCLLTADSSKRLLVGQYTAASLVLQGVSGGMVCREGERERERGHLGSAQQSTIKILVWSQAQTEVSICYDQGTAQLEALCCAWQKTQMLCLVHTVQNSFIRIHFFSPLKSKLWILAITAKRSLVHCKK